MARRRVRSRIERQNVEILGDDYTFTRDPELAAKRAAARRERNLNSESPKVAICAIRGCRTKLYEDRRLTVCLEHAVTIWEIIERFDQDPYLREAVPREIGRRDAIRAEHRKIEDAETRRWVNSPDTVGDIYYARVGNLIKVGWTTDLYGRIKSYGADAELLAHYEATRRDETNLHRNLVPSRAKGREWYHDDPIIRSFIYRTIREHGPPRFTETGWTRPKKATMKVKSYRG